MTNTITVIGDPNAQTNVTGQTASFVRDGGHGAASVAQTFTSSAFGHATLVTRGTTGDFASVVLTGVDHTLAATLSSHALTWS